MEENIKKQNLFHLTRRMFINLGLWGSGAISAWGIFQFMSYDPPRETLSLTVTLDEPNTYSEGSVTFIPEVKAWLIRDRLGLYAVSAICTHLGCTIGKGEDKFDCPCHGSQFNLGGKVMLGPASKELSHFDVRLSPDSKVVIDRMVTVPFFTRLSD